SPLRRNGTRASRPADPGSECATRQSGAKRRRDRWAIRPGSGRALSPIVRGAPCPDERVHDRCRDRRRQRRPLSNRRSSTMAARRGPGRQRERGAYAVAFVLTVVLLMGFIGLALDAGRLFVAKTELQNAAD